MRQTALLRVSAALGVAIMGLLSSAVGWSQSLIWLGTLGGGASEAYAISADGRVVVGMSNTRAFRWTADTGMPT
jgi:probable HAF family extracellular repeat protein